MNTAYPLFPVTIVTFLFYFTTFLFSKWKIVPVKSHRKFWNYLLLLTFLVSGILGMLSVVKVNYKLEIPGYDTYMQWHVSFGIAMVFIAFFHLSWHLKYYFGKNKNRSAGNLKSPGVPGIKTASLRVLLFLLGLTSIISQVIFIREFISVLSGNELVVGIVMAAWMLLTAWGAFYARKTDFSFLTLERSIAMLATLALLPALSVALLYILKDLLFPPGTLVNILGSTIAAFILLFPVCFLAGALFTAFSTALSEVKKENLLGNSYAVEALGSLAGGLVFTIILACFFSSFGVVAIVSAIVLLTGARMKYSENPKTAWKLILPGLLIPVLVFVIQPEKYILKTLFHNQEIVSNQNTRYGNLVVTRQSGQLNVYENNELQFYTDNLMQNEEAVHFAMVQHKNPRRVLLISGGMAGMMKEIEKYPVEEIVYLEKNPALFRLQNLIPEKIDSTKVKVVKKDIRKFIASTGETFDVILINLPAPLSLAMNRFYTKEFFGLLKKHCTPESVICTSLPSTANYAEDNALELNASLWRTLGTIFTNRLLLTGEQNYFIASGAPLRMDVAALVSEKNVPTDYVNPYYLDDRLLAMRSQTLTSQFDEAVPVNRDFSPFLFTKQIGHWLSYFGLSYQLFVLIPALIFLLLFIRTDRITIGLYTGGFTAASLEVALLLAYQVYYGSLYLSTALFFAVFMAGLAFGSSGKISLKFNVFKSYYLVQFSLAVFACLMPVFIGLTGKFNALGTISQVIYFGLIFCLAAGVGFEFLLASQLRAKSFGEISGENYTFDLLGSAFGAFLTAIVLLPVAGLWITCLTVAGLNVLSGTMAWSAKNDSIFLT